MQPGIVLVHGYTGSPHELVPLKERLTHNHGPGSATIVCLPGHDGGEVPPFDREAFVESIADAVDAYMKEGREIILIGHSTGGTLLLSFMAKRSLSPSLLILGATPKVIDSTWFGRWSYHRAAKAPLPLNVLAKMVTCINATGSVRFRGDFPVLVVQGEEDGLVTPEEASLWRKDSFLGPVRTVLIKGADHTLFCGAASLSAIDAVAKAIHDAVIAGEATERHVITERLREVEPGAGRFLDLSPLSICHLERSPSGQALAGSRPLLSSTVPNHPIIANIEVTTRCDLHCRYCARFFRQRLPRDMEREAFRRILEVLPHAYRITLVGLGEPLLHPDAVGFVKEAAASGRRVAMVTNGRHLDRPLSEQLIEAGIQSIAVSIDAPDEKTASEVRRGSDLPRVIANTKGFTEIAAASPGVSTAIFAAVSVRTAPLLGQLIDLAIDLGVHVVMLTDLNYQQNLSDSLWKNLDEELYDTLHAAISRAFSKGLPLLSVRGLEEFGLRSRYRQFLLLSPGQLFKRSSTHTWCSSPWQTIPVDVNGNVTICDCQPENIIGNLFTETFENIWNGEVMARHRHEMLSETPPHACSICPRF